MKVWLVILSVAAVCRTAATEDLYPSWAAGVDSLGRASVSTDADGYVLIESPEFPGGLGLVAKDAHGEPLKAIDVDFHGAPDSTIVAQLRDPAGRFAPGTLWGKSIAGSLSFELEPALDPDGAIADFGWIVHMDRLPHFDHGSPRYFRLADLIEGVRTAFPNAAGRWLIMLEGEEAQVLVRAFEGGVMAFEDGRSLADLVEWRRWATGGTEGDLEIELSGNSVVGFIGVTADGDAIDAAGRSLVSRIQQKQSRRWSQVDEQLLVKVSRVEMAVEPPGAPTIVNLSVNLAGADLRNVDLRGAQLHGLDLREAILDDMDLDGTDLAGVNFFKASLRGVDFRDADLGGTNLRAALLMRSNLSGVDLQRTRLTGAHLEEADLRGANLTGVHMEGVYLRGALLDEANLEGADFSRAIWTDGNQCLENSVGQCLTREDAKTLFLSGASNQCDRCWFAAGELDGVDLVGANLENAVIAGDLTGAHFEGADLRYAELRNATLRGAFLLRANLLYAQLPGVDLTGAHLDSADLSQANLRDATLAGAQLREANLHGAELRELGLRLAVEVGEPVGA